MTSLTTRSTIRIIRASVARIARGQYVRAKIRGRDAGLARPKLSAACMSSRLSRCDNRRKLKQPEAEAIREDNIQIWLPLGAASRSQYSSLGVLALSYQLVPGGTPPPSPS